MAAEEDPFGAFGDSDDDGDGDNNVQDVKKAQDLLQAANTATTKTCQTDKDRSTTTTDSTTPVHGQGSGVDLVDLTNLEECSFPAWDSPVYVSSDVKLVSSLPLFGGGRGFVALRQLAPGTLVLLEEALMMWPDEQLGQPLSLTSVQRLVNHENAAKIVACLEDFHPTKTVVDGPVESEFPVQVETMMESLLTQQQSNTDANTTPQLLAQIVQECKTLQNRDNTAISTKDILRLLLALRYNGLESGLYCYVAMINHSCQPNCVKFLPKAASSNTDDNTDDFLPPTFSEVRTTRWVNPGECLTISYVPRILSHASRRHHLWEQHRFDIGAQLTPSLQRMEVVTNGGLPPSSKEYVDDNSITSRIENAIAEMDVLFQTTKNAILSSSSSVVSGRKMVEQAKALEVSLCELFSQALEQLQNNNHILLIPCLVLHLDACDLVLQADAKSSTTAILSHKQRCMLLGRMVVTGMKLLELQQAYWGHDHYDVARTCLDLSQAIQELLSKSPDTLYQLETRTVSNHLKTFRDWSTLEHKHRKEHERIKEMYPRDAAKYILKKL
ncbi:expressed unknown protein [Seminavis robusta]|uniref:SET domain-containing protein n=1 Tax=Seminavis robusta TaxID=568900 RepID=A0A9N8EI77_9STRA|nr:expressed unknown protein [Seminavis robusta]|eukprot:Sro1141_g245710.1 n/a (555) ;mRNA; f:32992-34656